MNNTFNPTHQHYKGGFYQFLHNALDEETLEELVVYRDEDDQIWVRPKELFNTKFTLI